MHCEARRGVLIIQLVAAEQNNNGLIPFTNVGEKDDPDVRLTLATKRHGNPEGLRSSILSCVLHFFRQTGYIPFLTNPLRVVLYSISYSYCGKQPEIP